MAFTFSRATRCRTAEDDGECTDCGWKCHCIACSTNGGPEEFECQCSCRFWIVVCCVVVFGFFALFLSAVAYKRTILYLLSSGAVFYSGSLTALTLVTDNCVWPAFFSITMVFAFPCFYSCCWNYQTRRNESALQRPPDGTTTSAPPAQSSVPRTPEHKPTSTVVMLFPDGDMQLGVQDVELVSQSRQALFAPHTSSVAATSSVDQASSSSMNPVRGSISSENVA